MVREQQLCRSSHPPTGERERGEGLRLGRQRALTQKQTLGRWFECPSSLLERLQRRVALEALGERGSSFGTEVVELETVRGRWGANGQRAGVHDRCQRALTLQK